MSGSAAVSGDRLGFSFKDEIDNILLAHGGIAVQVHITSNVLELVELFAL